MYQGKRPGEDKAAWYKKDKKKKCGRKVRYPDSEKAETAALHLMKVRGTHISAYKCPYCRYWHIGHTPYEELPNRG